MVMRHVFLAMGLMLAACGGESGYGDEPVAEDDMTDAEEPAPTPERDPSMPLCEGETGPEPGDCQTLVYKLATGYCERFSPCDQL
jgi:hypothetical protein